MQKVSVVFPHRRTASSKDIEVLLNIHICLNNDFML